MPTQYDYNVWAGRLLASPVCGPAAAHICLLDLAETRGEAIGHYVYDFCGSTSTSSGSAQVLNVFCFSCNCLYNSPRAVRLYYYGLRSYNPSLGRWMSRDPIGEIGGRNLYQFIRNSPLKGFDSLGLEFEDLGYHTVFDLLAGGGHTDATFEPEAECRPRVRFLFWCWCELVLTKFHVAVQSQIPLYDAPRGWTQGSPDPIPRYSDAYIALAIPHEEKHRRNFETWHDDNLSKAQSDFKGTSLCKECERQRTTLLKKWNDTWQTFWKGEEGHTNPSWSGWTEPAAEYAPESDWWHGDPPLPANGPYDDPLGEF